MQETLHLSCLIFSLGQTRLTEDTEKIVVKFINVLTDWRVSIDKMDLCINKTYLDKKGAIDRIFKDNMPGNDWVDLFIK